MASLTEKIFLVRKQKQGYSAEMLPRTPEAISAIEQAVIRGHGDLTTACRALQISPIDLNQWAMSDPEVAQRLHTAQLLGWSTIEAEAIRRAVDGHDETVWYQGVEVGTKKVYSDSLLQTLLKARVAGYSENTTHMHMHQHNVNLMPRAETYEEWVAQRQSFLDNKKELLENATMMPAIQDADYEEVQPTNGLPDWL